MTSLLGSMSRRHIALAAGAFGAFALLAGCGGDDDSLSAAPAPAAAPPAPSATACAALTSASGVPANVVIAAATFVAAASGVPEHCNLSGTINANRAGSPSSVGVPQTYAIKWSVRLPTSWNNRFAMEGGSGLDGSVPSTTARLALGYATAADDSGHDNAVNSDPLAGGAAAFGTDYQARVDFAYNAIDKTQQLAKSLMNAYYGAEPAKSYFEGCSMGGREAMMVTQRLPDQFDGVVVGDPGFKLTAMSTQEVYDAKLFGALATSMGLQSTSGAPLLGNTFTNQDLQLVSKAILDACDAKDGLVDGMVNAPMQCTTEVVNPHFDALECSAGKTASCLTATQLTALKTFYAGPVTPTGRKPYYGWMYDPGIAGCTSATDCNTPTATNIATGWRGWKLGSYQTNLATATNNGSDYTVAGGALSTMVAPTPFAAPAPTAADGLLKLMLGYDLDAYASSIFATTVTFPSSGYDLLDVDSTDRAAFNNHGSKMIIYQPQSGGPFSPLAMVDWYESLNKANGGTPYNYAAVQKFARLFMMPGAQHCGGGPSTSTIDAFTAVVNWVENGTAPTQIVGTAPASTPWPGRKRPLCPYPQIATYNGTGSIEADTSFMCK